MSGINVARTCDKLSAKLEVTYQRNGFLVRLLGGSGIVCTKFEPKNQHDNQIKSNQINYHLQYKDKNAIAPRKIRFTVL